jgi:hypothetical protein
VKERVRIPHPEKSEDEFVERLVKSASHFGGGVLIPTSDATLATTWYLTLRRLTYPLYWHHLWTAIGSC